MRNKNYHDNSDDEHDHNRYHSANNKKKKRVDRALKTKDIETLEDLDNLED